MKNLYVYAYNAGSNGAQELADALGVNRIRHHSSKFRGASFKKVINWGATELPPEVKKCTVANPPSAIMNVNNKLRFFQRMTDAPVPPRTVPWTSSVDVAQKWLKDGLTVVARTSLTGHSGHGIIITEPGGTLPKAQLYTQYVKRNGEYRVHVMNGRVIDAQRKIRDPNREPTDWKVRSHDNGFIFVRNGFTLPKDCAGESLKAFVASGLDFGAVDVIADKNGKAYVLEINSAPGLEGQTVNNYAGAFKQALTR